MITLLESKPHIGIIGGIGGGAGYYIQQALTNDDYLKYAAGAGVWLGIIAAILTIWARIINIRRDKAT